MRIAVVVLYYKTSHNIFIHCPQVGEVEQGMTVKGCDKQAFYEMTLAPKKETGAGEMSTQ